MGSIEMGWRADMDIFEFKNYLRAYFSEVFEVEKEEIDPDANLFEMGLDSLQSFELVCVVKNELSISLDIARFRECRTINQIADTFGKAQ